MTSRLCGYVRVRRGGLLAASRGWGCLRIRGGLTCAALAAAVLVVSLSAPAGAFAADDAAISGHVTNAANAPLQGICVSAQPSPSGPGGGSAQTDASGDYTIGALAAGSYKVQFSACAGGNYVAEWLDNKPDSSTANTISLAAGATSTGIDAQLAPGANISGHVTSTSGPLEGVCVAAQPVVIGNLIGYATTNASGDYTITGLAPGSYKVQFAGCGPSDYVAEYWNDRPDSLHADTITLLSAEGRTGIDAQLAKFWSQRDRSTTARGEQQVSRGWALPVRQ
jgi:Carboxypeptidase regulatory-like domain